MILGLGNDIVDIRRIEALLERFGAKFENKIFTPGERAKARSRAGAGTLAATYAKRFAAKEAFAKALGSGIAQGVLWKEIEVVNLPSGTPTLHISGQAQHLLSQLTPHGMRPQIMLTMSDEYPIAQAQVIIQALAAA